MNKQLFAIAAAALVFGCGPSSAQSAQDQLDQRYDRALAAGYKALFLCSAIGNAEAAGATRTPESVHQWELTGIQAPLNDMVRELPYEIVRRPTGQIAHVAVEWADDMPDRVAIYFGADTGCSIMPIGTPEDFGRPDLPVEAATEEEVSDAAAVAPLSGPVTDVVAGVFDSKYGEGARTTAAIVRQLDADGTPAQTSVYADGFTADTPQRTWSVAKSVASTLVGMAVQSGEYAVDDPININYWRSGGSADLRDQITIDHALRMASGRYSDTPGNRTDPIYWGGTTVDERATYWPMIHKPGTVFRYANNDTLMAVKAIADFLGHYKTYNLARQIGMENTTIETDSRSRPVLSSQVWATAEDLAALGELYLNDGVKDGERLLPEGWVEYVSQLSGPQPKTGNFGYGAAWWTFRHPERDLHDDLPQDGFLARGNRGQYVVVIPSRNVVIVRRGEDTVGTRFDIAAFTRDVLAALDQR